MGSTFNKFRNEELLDRTGSGQENGWPKMADRDGSNGWGGSALTGCSRVDHEAANLVRRSRAARLYAQMDATSNRQTRSVYMGPTTWWGWVQHQQLRAPSDNDYGGSLQRLPRSIDSEEAGQTRVVLEVAAACGKLVGKLLVIAVISGTLWHFFVHLTFLWHWGKAFGCEGVAGSRLGCPVGGSKVFNSSRVSFMSRMLSWGQSCVMNDEVPNFIILTSKKWW